jgi:anthranilate phosphoribosyltransferase
MTATEGYQSWPAVLGALIRREDLAAATTAWAMNEIMSGAATSAQVAAFAVALRAKGETVDEIEGLVASMYRHANLIEVPGPTVDVVGTGGDGMKTVNISTMSAIVAAGAGATVVKHGNRSASSSSGAADVLEQLGVRLDLEPRRVAEVAGEAGITFCFAQAFHPAYRHTATARREMGVPTAFNLLGPLTNPAQVKAQAVGVSDQRMAPVLAGVLARRGNSALVFRGQDGLDELTVTTTSTVWTAHSGTVTEEIFDPREIGIEFAPVEALRGADAVYNADVARRLLAGETGPVRDAVLLNTGATLAALAALEVPEGKLAPLAERLADGVQRARTALETGAAAAALERWSAATQRG